MSDNRVIEIIVLVIGTRENAITDEPGNKVIPIRKSILVNEILSVEDIARLLSQAITRIGEDN